MNRIRTVLYECALIVLFGVACAIALSFALSYFRGPSIEDFKREYAAARSTEKQIVVAEKYYGKFPLQDLLKAIEETYADIGCHIDGHAMGRVLYRHNPNFADAVKQCGGSCTYGCFHGVQMEMFKTDSDTLGGVINDESPQAYTKHILSIAKDICTKPEVQSVVRLRQCVHGLGHMFVYNAEGNLKTATDECDSIFDPKSARSCRTGAFMEKILGSPSTSTAYLTNFDPCDAYPDDAYICYRYKAYSWLYYYKSIDGAFKVCDSLGDERRDCIAGVGSAAATPELLGTNEGIEHICGSLEGADRVACESGAYLNIINLNDGDDSEHVCDIVAPDFRSHCLDTRARYNEQIYYGSEAKHLLAQ